MRVITLEDHFLTKALHDANAEHPLLKNQYSEEVLRGLSDLDELRLASMDAAGIDVQVLSHTTPGPEGLDPELAVRLSVDANDVAATAVAAHPDRFAAFATLPAAAPEAAARELERAVNDLGFVGGVINGHVGGRYLDDQFFWPMFEAADALDVPIYLHPALPPQAVADASYSGLSPMLSSVLAGGAWGWHIDTGLHTLRLIFSGMLDRFPRLQLIIGHLGEALPFMLGRTASITDRSGAYQRPLADYFADNISVTTSGFFYDAPFAAAVQALGIDRILFSVDYPYASNSEGRAFLDRLPVSNPDREKIAHGNAERLLKLPG